MSALSLLEELGRMRRELQADFPGRQIWYVFHHDGSATWHARPNPWLSAPSPDDLRKLKQRDSMVTRFAELDEPALFLLSLKAGGTGLNLTAASHVIHIDRWWNPAVEDQATDRAFRIGQRRNGPTRPIGPD